MELNIDYSVDAFTTALEAVVAEAGPDYVYPETERQDGSCVYVIDGEDGPKGSCIIGRAVIRLGIPPQIIAEEIPAEELLERLGWTDPDVIVAAQAAQATQDRHTFHNVDNEPDWNNWGAALAAYHRILNA